MKGGGKCHAAGRIAGVKSSTASTSNYQNKCATCADAPLNSIPTSIYTI